MRVESPGQVNRGRQISSSEGLAARGEGKKCSAGRELSAGLMGMF